MSPIAEFAVMISLVIVAWVLWWIHGAVERLVAAQNDANQIAKDRLSLERQCFERDARRPR